MIFNGLNALVPVTASVSSGAEWNEWHTGSTLNSGVPCSELLTRHSLWPKVGRLKPPRFNQWFLPVITPWSILPKVVITGQYSSEWSTETAKANALNDQFQSVFSPHKFKGPCPEVTTRFARLWCQPTVPAQCPYPKMPNISIAAEGIDKLLVGLTPHKASGPDKFKPIVLQTLHKELAPILQLFFLQRSLDTGLI